jgi:hypothetical protein
MMVRLLAFALALTASVPAVAETLDIYVIDVEGGNAVLFVSPSHELTRSPTPTPNTP